MLAVELIERYRSDNLYRLSPGYIAQLRWTLNAYIRHCGRNSLSAFNATSVNAWVDHLASSRAPDTVRTQRGNLLTIWWFAYRHGIVAEPPLRVRRVRPISRSPAAWTLDEVHRLANAADASGIWWGSLVRVGYDTGMRLGDLLRLRVADRTMNMVTWRAGKTCRVHSARIRSATRRRLDRQTAGRRPSDLIWPLEVRRETFYRRFGRLVLAAGIRRGTFRWIRRSAATQLERVSPGMGTRLLGHASGATTAAFYLDRTQLPMPPLPPW